MLQFPLSWEITNKLKTFRPIRSKFKCFRESWGMRRTQPHQESNSKMPAMTNGSHASISISAPMSWLSTAASATNPRTVHRMQLTPKLMHNKFLIRTIVTTRNSLNLSESMWSSTWPSWNSRCQTSPTSRALSTRRSGRLPLTSGKVAVGSTGCWTSWPRNPCWREDDRPELDTKRRRPNVNPPIKDLHSKSTLTAGPFPRQSDQPLPFSLKICGRVTGQMPINKGRTMWFFPQTKLSRCPSLSPTVRKNCKYLSKTRRLMMWQEKMRTVAEMWSRGATSRTLATTWRSLSSLFEQETSTTAAKSTRCSPRLTFSKARWSASTSQRRRRWSRNASTCLCLQMFTFFEPIPTSLWHYVIISYRIVSELIPPFCPQTAFHDFDLVVRSESYQWYPSHIFYVKLSGLWWIRLN